MICKKCGGIEFKKAGKHSGTGKQMYRCVGCGKRQVEGVKPTPNQNQQAENKRRQQLERYHADPEKFKEKMRQHYRRKKGDARN